MADGSRETSRADVSREDAVGGIAPDPIDVRDRFFEPTLAALKGTRLPVALMDVLRQEDNAWGLPREQGQEGSCGGQALAALIDIERVAAEVRPAAAASARMIYEMAKLKPSPSRRGEARPARVPAEVSLRDVIKAFYNYGVCTNRGWEYKGNDPNPGQLDVAKAREAREISLGAYYRLRPNLNTYHSAISEAGAVVVSAKLHDGWLHADVRRRRNGKAPGVIAVPKGDRGSLGDEGHAFVIVGYTPDGFLVLNSWGRSWGNWRPEGGDPVPGLALWTYADWADSIMDGWVLRLGASAAAAFDYSIGDQGLGFSGDGAVRSTPVHAILGNFLHTDDGRYVARGAYVSTGLTLRETRRLLIDGTPGRPPYRGAFLTFASGLQGLKDAAETVARRKELVRGAGWYPFTLLWCVDYVEQARDVLEGVFKEAMERAGSSGPDLDRVIEERAHGVGRAFWREMIGAATRGAAPKGPLHDLARAAAEIVAARPGFRLRILAESEGALALSALLCAMHTKPYADVAPSFFAMLDSVDLVAPPIGYEEFSALALYLNAGWGRARPDRRLHLHLPTGRDEKRLTVGPYRRSYFELVRLAFQPRDECRQEPCDVVCRSRAADAIARKWDAWTTAPRTVVDPIRWDRSRPPDGEGGLSQLQLLYRSDVNGRLRAILRRPAPTDAPPTRQM